MNVEIKTAKAGQRVGLHKMLPQEWQACLEDVYRMLRCNVRVVTAASKAEMKIDGHVSLVMRLPGLSKTQNKLYCKLLKSAQTLSCQLGATMLWYEEEEQGHECYWSLPFPEGLTPHGCYGNLKKAGADGKNHSV